jgi:hypothetical protein
MSNISPRIFLFAVFLFAILFGPTAGRGAAQTVEPLANGAIVHAANGIVHIEVCSVSVIHILASASPIALVTPPVPAVIRPCDSVRNSRLRRMTQHFRIQTSELRDRDRQGHGSRSVS